MADVWGPVGLSAICAVVVVACASQVALERLRVGPAMRRFTRALLLLPLLLVLTLGALDGLLHAREPLTSWTLVIVAVTDGVVLAATAALLALA